MTKDERRRRVNELALAYLETLKRMADEYEAEHGIEDEAA